MGQELNDIKNEESEEPQKDKNLEEDKNEQSDDDSSSEEEIKQETHSVDYNIGENIDCLDEMNKWLNAEIISINGSLIKVHFSGYIQKFDDWISKSSDRIQKQWRKGDQFRLNNRIDVQDTYKKWIEARVIKVDKESIRVHYKGFTERWDEDLSFDSDRIEEVGRHSKAFGIGRVHKNQIERQKRLDDKEDEYDEDKEERQRQLARDQEFENLMSEKGWRIKKIGADGNCLFRAVSHQIYGTEDHHKYIRQR